MYIRTIDNEDIKDTYELTLELLKFLFFSSFNASSLCQVLSDVRDNGSP